MKGLAHKNIFLCAYSILRLLQSGYIWWEYHPKKSGILYNKNQVGSMTALGHNVTMERMSGQEQDTY